MPGRGRGDSGLSLVEVIVAAGIFILIAFQLSAGLTTNMGARKQVEQQRQFYVVDSALRSAAFQKVSALAERGFDCRKPKVAFKSLWTTQPFQEVRFRLVDSLKPKVHPKQMQRRCQEQTYESRVRNGFYFCLELEPAPGAAKTFLSTNDVFAEVFYGFWDAATDTEITCDKFNDRTAPLRGAKLFYTLYWRPKLASSRETDRFTVHTGVMYGQTKRP